MNLPQQLGFMATTDPNSLFLLENMFLDEEEVTYFIEDATTHQWLTDAHEWTNEPTEAMVFYNYYKAHGYAGHNGINNFIITEHLFIE